MQKEKASALIKDKMQVYNSVDDVDGTLWQEANSQGNVYLSLPYLKSFQEAHQDAIQFRYLLLQNSNGALVCAVAQAVVLKGNSAIQEANLRSVCDKLRDKFVDGVGLKLFMCGNPFVCGENGFAHNASISKFEAAVEVNKALLSILENEKKLLKTNLLVFKDFKPESAAVVKQLQNKKHKHFQIDVAMVLQLAKEWQSLSDYLNAMQTKFRTKAKAVFQRSEGIIIRDLTAEDIQEYEVRIQYLQNQVLAKAAYSFAITRTNYFAELKQQLGDTLRFTGFYLDDILVGFSLAIQNQQVLEANFVGIEYDLNKEYALYQRMLYHFVETGIQLGCTAVNFGRTAEEIKSCLGAEPIPMDLLAKHKNAVLNPFVHSILSTIQPNKFEIRKPFKKQYYDNV